MRLSPSRRLTAPYALVLALTATLALAGPPALLAGAISPLAALQPSAADAATLAVVSCSANGAPAPIEGWTSSGVGNNTGAYNSCPTGGTFGAAIGEAAPQPPGETTGWTFTPPEWATIGGGTISAGLVVPYGQGGVAWLGAPTANYSLSDIIVACQFNLPCPESAAPPGAGSYAGTFPIRPGGNLYALAACAGLGAQGCPGGYGPPATAAVVIATATIELTSNATPAAAAFAGGLLAPGAVSGTQPLTFTATEANGPGIATVTVTVDGAAVFSGPIDGNGGKCAPIGTDPNGVPEYTTATPCRQSLGVSIPVNTGLLPDGNHHLAVTVTDAAGATTQVLNQPFTSANRTKVSAQLDSSLHAPGTPGGGPAPSAPVYAIVLDPATQALIHGVNHDYANSGLALSGTLRNSAGVPAPGVPLTLLAQNGGSGNPQPIAHATSDAAGHWTLNAPLGPSRVLTITYGTQPQATAAQAGVSINETVIPNLSLHIKTLGGGRLRFTGKLDVSPLGSPLPTVIIQVLAHRRWQAVGDAITVNSAGDYRLSYTAGRSVIRGHYTFRAVSIATSLYTAATSATRKTVIR